jgi:hypothetical protein
VPSLLVSVAAIAKIASDVPPPWGLIGFLGCASLVSLIAFVAKVVQARRLDHYKDNERIDLLGCLHPTYRCIIEVRRMAGATNTGKLRLTIHRVDHESEIVEQCVGYVGESEESRKAGRRFKLSQGIIGCAARTEEPLAGERKGATSDDYVNELVKEWGYSRAEAEGVDRNRWSFMAVPLLGDGAPKPKRCIGVLYADSIDRSFFTDEVQELVIRAAEGMAEFIKVRYRS